MSIYIKFKLESYLFLLCLMIVYSRVLKGSIVSEVLIMEW